MPEKAFGKIKEYIKPQWKMCFFAALLAGFFAHFYKIANWLPNWDSLVFRYDSQNMVALGRWFLPVVCSVSSFYDLPFLNSVIAILFHALGAVSICRVLNVKKNVTAFLIGAMIVSFPTVTSVLMYGYVADGYSIAFFLSCVAAECLVKNKRWGLFVAPILIALSVGIYQAYVTVTIMLVLVCLIEEIVCQEQKTLMVVKKGIKIFTSGFCGMLLYYAVMKTSLMVSGAALLNYQGLNSVTSFEGFDILASLYTIKETFIDFFFDFSKGINLFVLLNIVCVLFAACMHIRFAYMNKAFEQLSKIVALVFFAVMLVIGAGALAFINSGIDYHNLMLMGYCAFYLLFIILYERGGKEGEKFESFKCWFVLIISALIIFNSVIIANVSYHKAQMAYEKSYGVLIRIVDRIEQTPNARECEEILVIGSLEDSLDYSVTFPPDITGITDGYILRADDENVGQSVVCSAINDYCSKEYRCLSGERKKAFLKSASVQKMGTWPAKDCIAVEDNVIVVKLGE